MDLVDSCGWLEYLADGPNADFFAPAIEQDVDFKGLEGVKYVEKG